MSSLSPDLNPSQRAAVEHGDSPLVVIAGAGTGKTRTLVHRVAHLLDGGIVPERILLLTFTRRAAAEMLRRLETTLQQAGREFSQTRRIWGGTFHAIGTRLLRVYGRMLGFEPGFTVLDRSDAEDLLDLVRTEQGLPKSHKRFPRKGTCLAIYSAVVNSRRSLHAVLVEDFPWCRDFEDELKKLFSGFVDRKEDAQAVDYDDLLLFWHALLEDEELGQRVRERFDCVLVDEYQDTNRLQAEILQRLAPTGKGLTVVGDDAQSIYSFRAATVRNILDFAETFPGTTTVKLEENYRSSPGILQLTNQVISEASEGIAKVLWSARSDEKKPRLVHCEDEEEQAQYLIDRVLEHREQGLLLKEQAVLFRTSHHSSLLETELSRRNIPFVKYGGLKFIEAAHVKDLIAFLRLVENPRDLVAGCRVLTLLPGIGPQRSRRLMDAVLRHAGQYDVWNRSVAPADAQQRLQELAQLLTRLRQNEDLPVSAQLSQLRTFYQPLLEEKYDKVEPRVRELEQLESLAGRYTDRTAMITEFALDPPASSEDLAGEPHLDEDYLILSTIHSAKGLEWKVVYTIHAADGNIPSDMSTKNVAQIDEERRLFYVALTRAKDWLYVCCPHRYYHHHRGPKMDQHGYAQLTRFLSQPALAKMEISTVQPAHPHRPDQPHAGQWSQSIRQRVKSMWDD